MPGFLKPFRAVQEADVINLYAWSGAVPATKGTIVKIVGSGWRSTDDPTIMLGGIGSAVTNTVSQRWGVLPKIAIAHSGDVPFGVLLYDVRETDENGESLLYNPRKRDEMQAVLSGQAVPVAVRGTFLYSGVSGNPQPGNFAYVADFGTLAPVAGGSTTPYASQSLAGKFLGAKADDGTVLVKIDL